MQIAEDLGYMLISNRPHRLEFNHQYSLDEQVSVEFAQDRSIFIVNRQRVLLLHPAALFSQTMSQGIFVYLLQMPVAMVAMNGKARFTNEVTQPVDIGVFHGAST